MAELSYEQRKKIAREDRNLRARRNLQTGAPSELLARAPKDSVAMAAAFFGLALASHAALGAWALAGTELAHSAPEPIRVRMVQAEPAPEPQPQPKVAAEEPIAAEPAPRPRPRPRRKVTQPRPEPAEAVENTEAPPPVAIVGLTLESTTQGSSGPAFAVGNTLMGVTDAVAAAPVARAKVPARPPVSQPSRNRVARGRAKPGIAVTPARRLSRVEPAYPPLLQQQRLEGDVTVRVTLDARGAVEDVELVRGAPQAPFNHAALSAARRERFAPETRGGQPVSTSITYTYRFRIP